MTILKNVLATLGYIPQWFMTLVIAVVAFALSSVPSFATDDLFTTITTEVTSDAAKVVAFSLIGITVTIAFYLWALGKKSINKAK